MSCQVGRSRGLQHRFLLWIASADAAWFQLLPVLDAVFRLVFAQMAASCAALDEALTKASDSMEVFPVLHADIVTYHPEAHNPLRYHKQCPSVKHPDARLGRPDVGTKSKACPAQQNARMRVMLEPSWAFLEFELASVLHCIVNSYWARMQAGRIFRPTLQVNPADPHLIQCPHHVTAHTQHSCTRISCTYYAQLYCMSK